MEKRATPAQFDECAAFYLAQLLEARGRTEYAQKVWIRLSQHLTNLSRYQRTLVCKQLPEHPNCLDEVTARSEFIPEIPWSLPVEAGLELSDKAIQYFSGWDVNAFNWQQEISVNLVQASDPSDTNNSRTAYSLEGNIYKNTNGAVVLNIDNFVDMVVLRGAPLGTISDLEQCCGKPTMRQTVTRGVLWSYGDERYGMTWTAWVQDDQIREVWVYRR